MSENQKEPPKVALPAYRIEPPDVIEIEMPKVVPLPSYRAAVRSVTGQYLVGPDGTINLRQYGVVVISGKTIADARIAIQNHLKQYLDSPELSVKVVDSNLDARCRLIDAKGSVRYAPLNLLDGQEGLISYRASTSVCNWGYNRQDLKQPHIIQLDEGTMIHVTLAGQQPSGATLDVTVDQSIIRDVDTRNVGADTTVQIPHIAFHRGSSIL